MTETGNAYSITITDNTVSAAVLNTLDSKTSVAINATAVTTITGTAADLILAYTANLDGTITGLGNEQVIVTDDAPPAASLNTINSFTAGVVDVSAANILRGSAADLVTAYSAKVSGAIVGLGNEPITVNEFSTVAQFNVLAANTTGVITANISNGDMATLNNITESGNALAITVRDTTVSAAELITLSSKTTKDVTVNSSTITGTAAQVITAYTATDSIKGLGNEAVTLSDTSIDASVLKNLDALTSGLIDASSVNTITGTAGDINTVYAAGTS